MGRGDRDESVSPRRRVRQREPQGQGGAGRGSRSQSVSPRRNLRNVSLSPQRNPHARSAGRHNNLTKVDDRELDLRLLNVTGDALGERGRRTNANRMTPATGRSRTTPRLVRRGSPVRSRRGRALSGVERERQEAIDRENRILLRKILEQHHGIRRNVTTSVPSASSCRSYSPRRHPTSRQINDERRRHRTDYENLLLLQKIQNVKPSRQISASFRNMRIVT